MSNIINLSDYRALKHDPELSYKQLSNHLNISERFIRARVAEGMPASYDWSGKRRSFRLSEVEAWLNQRRDNA